MNKPSTIKYFVILIFTAFLVWGLPQYGNAAEKTPGFPQGVSVPLKVGVSMYVTSLNKITEGAGIFDANMDLRLRWNDPSLIFDAKINGSGVMEFSQEAAKAKLDSIWTPKLTIVNMSEKDSKIEKGLFIYADGTVEYIQRMKGVFEQKYRTNGFPFDVQGLSIRLTSNQFNINDIQLVQEQQDINSSGLSDKLKLSGWNVKRLEFSSSRMQGWNGDFYPVMEGKIIVSRLPLSHIISLLAPFLLVLIVPTILTLYVKADIAPRITAWGASIMALIALNFTFTLRYNYLDAESFVAQLMNMGFCFQLIMVFLALTILNPGVADTLAKKIKNEHVIPELITIMRWLVPIFFITIIIYRALMIGYSQ